MVTAATFIVTGMTKTQLRRQQRRHSQVSYNKLRLELLNVVKPLPYPAIVASDLEQFTTSLFCTSGGASEPCRGLSCKWCGIWLPLPGKSPISNFDEPSSLAQFTERVQASAEDAQTLTSLPRDKVIYVFPARRALRNVSTTDALSPTPSLSCCHLGFHCGAVSACCLDSEHASGGSGFKCLCSRPQYEKC